MKIRTKLLIGSQKGRYRSEDSPVCVVRIILKRILKVRSELDSYGSQRERLARFCEDDNEPLASIRCGEFLNNASYY